MSKNIKLTEFSSGAGWACKLSKKNLTQVLGNLKQSFSAQYTIGYNSADDAAVYELSNGKLLLQSVDFFTPIVDDPFDFGQIAAANSLSDIYAMGGKPLFALNVAAFPEDKLPIEILTEILRDIKNYELEFRIAELESKFSKDLSEATFNELKELKKQQKIN